MTKRRRATPRRSADLNDRELVAWAKRTIHGLDTSEIFVGILNDGDLSAARVEFYLHVGYSLIMGKQILFAVPIGTVLDPKLEAVADRLIWYDPENLASLEAATVQALTELGVNPQ